MNTLTREELRAQLENTKVPNALGPTTIKDVLEPFVIDELMSLFDTYSTQVRIDEVNLAIANETSLIEGDATPYRYFAGRLTELSGPPKQPTNGSQVKGQK